MFFGGLWIKGLHNDCIKRTGNTDEQDMGTSTEWEKLYRNGAKKRTRDVQRGWGQGRGNGRRGKWVINWNFTQFERCDRECSGNLRVLLCAGRGSNKGGRHICVVDRLTAVGGEWRDFGRLFYLAGPSVLECLDTNLGRRYCINILHPCTYAAMDVFEICQNVPEDVLHQILRYESGITMVS